jgi:hypothetical protein
MILLASPAYIKENTVLHYNVDDGYIKPLISSVQNTKIIPIIGSALFNEITAQVEAGTVTSLNENLIKEYIRPVLKWEVCSQYVRTGTYQLRNKGAGSKSGDGFTPLGEGELFAAKNIFKDQADYYRLTLSKYLRQNENSFPLYKTPPVGIDVVHPERETLWRSQFILETKKHC